MPKGRFSMPKGRFGDQTLAKRRKEIDAKRPTKLTLGPDQTSIQDRFAALESTASQTFWVSKASRKFG